MSIDANNNRFIRELLINNPPTCSIWHSGLWAHNARNGDGRDSKTIVTARRADPEAKGVFQNFSIFYFRK